MYLVVRQNITFIMVKRPSHDICDFRYWWLIFQNAWSPKYTFVTGVDIELMFWVYHSSFLVKGKMYFEDMYLSDNECKAYSLYWKKYAFLLTNPKLIKLYPFKIKLTDYYSEEMYLQLCNSFLKPLITSPCWIAILSLCL